MKSTQRMRPAAGWDDEQIARIDAADTDILLIRRPLPVECAALVARGRVGEVRFQTTARGAKNKIDRGLDRLELNAPGGCRWPSTGPTGSRLRLQTRESPLLLRSRP